MTQNQKYFILINILAVTCIIQGAKAEPMNEEKTSSYSEVRIEALNKAVIAHASNSLPVQTEIILLGGEKKTTRKIKEELALHGVSIRMEEGKYVDVSKHVANGHSLNTNDQVRLAIMNDLHQAYCANLQADQKVPGAIRAIMGNIKRELKEHGISLRQDDDLFIVHSVSKETVRGEGVSPANKER